MFFPFFLTELPDGTTETLVTSERIVISERELYIQETVRGDTGLYTCSATNNMGQDSATAHLSVISK